MSKVKLDTLADCANELLAVAKHLQETVYADERTKMPEPIERLIIVCGALAHIDSTRPRSRP